jgi:Cu2+-exporting ATPase
VILSDELPLLSKAVASSRRAMRVIHENLGWAVVYNVVAIPSAAMGLVTPLVAAVGMSVSSIIVVLNALRALKVKG